MIRKLCLLLVILVAGLSATGQADTDLADYYLLKSRKQRKAAIITLSCSGATLLPGLILLSDVQPGWEHVNWNKALGGSALVIVGTGLAISSAILFMSSGKNRKKAERGRVFINRPIPVNMGRAVIVLPYSVGITVPVR